MRSKLYKISTAALALAITFTLSCDSASNPSALVGKWIGVSGENDRGNVAELLSDGTGILTIGSNGLAITWKTEKDRFYVTASGGAAEARSYKLQGSVLTFTYDNGKIGKYAKCNKDCEEAAKEYIKAELAKVEKSSFTDSRDNKSYKTLKLDNQIWMAENLNYEAEGSKCYENQEDNCQKYGRLYDWNTAMKACPDGWHLPSDAEWQVIVYFVGGDKVAGKNLKASSGWNDYNGSSGNGTDDFGFAALPGGTGNPGGRFSNDGYFGEWWSASEKDANEAWELMMDNRRNYVGKFTTPKGNLLSVRCVQD